MTSNLTRRAVLRGSLASLPLIAGRRSFAGAFLSDTRLPSVNLADELEVRTVVGLRPFRANGFRVELERVGRKTVVHNYGHGGAGLTLSWGTAKLAADLGLPGHRGRVAILGSGAVGLAMARLVQELGYPVSLYTSALPPETTSNLAGGQWGPSFVFENPKALTPGFVSQYLESCSLSYRRFQTMLGERYSVRWVTNYLVLQNPLPRGMQTPNAMPPTLNNPTAGMMPNFRVLGDRENPFGIGYAVQFSFLLIEPPAYLAALYSDFLAAGGKTTILQVKAVEELRKIPESLIFNCTGLGAQDIFHDTTLEPVRGQLSILLPQPEIEYATAYRDSYMFPRRDGILIGGTHEKGDWSLEPSTAAKVAMLNQQRELYRAMKSPS